MSDEGDARVYGGRYELRRGIARGGMADVFLAHDRLLDRPVALKILFPELSSDRAFVERFRREAQSAANLSHPNIVSVFDWGEEGDVYYIVMEFVDGRTLNQIVRQEGPLVADRAADVGIETALALGNAHSSNMIHRDVKPSNVLVRADGSVKVTDFGIARAITATDGLTQTGAVMGTATYFSPEQAQGHRLDQRSDLYSLGVVLYEMVTGVPPFKADSPVAVAYQHVREVAVPIRERNPDVPAAFERIIAKSMAKDPDQRYQNADEMAADLRRFRQGLPPMAAPIMAGAAIADPTTVQAPYQATQAIPAVMAGAGTPVPVPPQRRTGAFVTVVVLLLAVLAAVIFALAQALGGGDGNTARVTVPSVFGFSAQEARKQLEELNLVVLEKFEPNDVVEPGQVFEQSPEAGAIVDEGTVVTISVSEGAAPVAVPSVVGQDVADATDMLQGLDLVVATTTQADDNAPKGQVLAQSPEPGAQVAPGSTVRLTVSSGVEEKEIPNVAGQTPSQAANTLGQAGFVTTETTASSETVPAGKVIGTNPAAGSSAPKGSKVTIIVSSGSANATVPSVVGMTEPNARRALTEAGFQVVVEEQISSQDRIVLSQTPSGGSSAPRGSTVTIVVGRAVGPGSGD